MRDRATPAFGITKYAVYLVTWLLGGTTVIGREKIPAEGPVILAPNHRAYVDPPYLTLLTRDQQFYMAKEQLFKGLFGRYIAAMGAFPVKRGEGDRAALKKAIDHLRRGHIVTIFPEGKRSDDCRLLEAEKGFALIAMQTGAPIVPVAVEGTEKVMPKGSPILRRARVTLTAGAPLTADQILAEAGASPKDKNARDIIGARIMAEIAGLMRARA